VLPALHSFVIPGPPLPRRNPGPINTAFSKFWPHPPAVETLAPLVPDHDTEYRKDTPAKPVFMGPGSWR